MDALRLVTATAAQLSFDEQQLGSLEAGKLADIQIWNVPTLDDVICRIGDNAVRTVIRRGCVHEFGG